MKATIESRRERLERGDDALPWTETKSWIVDDDMATNSDTGESIPTAEVETGRAKEGRLLITRTIVRPEGATP